MYIVAFCPFAFASVTEGHFTLCTLTDPFGMCGRLTGGHILLGPPLPGPPTCSWGFAVVAPRVTFLASPGILHLHIVA